MSLDTKEELSPNVLANARSEYLGFRPIRFASSSLNILAGRVRLGFGAVFDLATLTMGG
jgi:hypothetical protein